MDESVRVAGYQDPDWCGPEYVATHEYVKSLEERIKKLEQLLGDDHK